MYRLTTLIQIQKFLVALAVLLSVIYLAGFRPLSDRAARMENSLADARKRLINANLRCRALLGLDSDALNHSHAFWERNLAAVQSASQAVMGRVQLDPELDQKLQLDFRLFDFDQRRSQIIAELRQKAEKHKVVLDDAVFAGFPDYLTSRERPVLLWAQLAMVNQTLHTALVHGPGQVKSLTLMPIVSQSSTNPGPKILEEIPLRLVLAGSMEFISNFIQSLPMRADELKAAYPKASLPYKPSLFLHRMVLKKLPGNPEEAQLEAIVSGFLRRDNPSS